MNGDVVLECDFNPSNPAPDVTWFASDAMVIEEDTTPNGEVLFLDGGRYLYIRALTAAERMMRYHCVVNNFRDENGVMPVRAPTTYTLNTDLANEGITVYRELGTMSGGVGDTVQFVYAAAARDASNNPINIVILCPVNEPFLILSPAGHVITVTVKPEAGSQDRVNFTCQVFGSGISGDIMGTVVVSSK